VVPVPQGKDAVPGNRAAAQTQAPIGKAAVSDTVDDLNQVVQNIQRQLEFSVDEESGKTIVRVMDSQTGDLIRQLPPEELLALSRYLKEYQNSLQTDENAKRNPGEAIGLFVHTSA